MLTYAERKRLAAQLKDSRPLAQKVAAAARQPVPVSPPSAIDREIERLEAEKESRRIARMDPESRRLATLREIRDREPVEPGKPHPRMERIERIIDSIVSNPEREFGEFEFATLVLGQHASGMDTSEADKLWRMLQEQETAYLTNKRANAIARQSELLAEIEALDVGLTEVADKPRPDAYGLLSRAIPTYGYGFGIGLSPAEFAEVQQAAGDDAAEQAVCMKYAAKIDNYVKAVEAEGAAE